MARVTNFELKIASTQTKLEKAQTRVKDLKAELAMLEEARNQEKNKELIALMEEKGMSAADVVNLIRQSVN